LAIDLVVTRDPEEDDCGDFLYLVHRRALTEVQITPLKTWKSQEESFPYSHIFSNLVPNRTRHLREDRCELTLLGKTEIPDCSEYLSVKILDDNSNYSFGMESLICAGHEIESAPFTCLKLGPFPPERESFALRIQCKIQGSSFADIISEDRDIRTRRYLVYGPSEVERRVVMVDLPQSQMHLSSEIHHKYKSLFQDLTLGNRIHPSIYSIVAVDNPNNNPDKIRCVKISENLFDLTESIQPAVYNHPDLRGITDRISWYASLNSKKDFYLQLIGPMEKMIDPVSEPALTG
jgi:hypothetical protein